MEPDFLPEDGFPFFRDWLISRYCETPQHLYRVARATGPYRDYNNLMDWYRYRYQTEKQRHEDLVAANPFHNQED